MAGWDGGEGAKGGNPRFEVKSEALVTQLFPTLYDPMDCQAPCPWNSQGKNTGGSSLFFFTFNLFFDLGSRLPQLRLGLSQG